MPDFKDMQGLERYIKMTLEQALKEVAKETAEFLSQRVQSDIYRKAESNYYERTREFLNAITQSQVKRVGNELQIEVFFDSSKIYPHSSTPNSGKFNAHMSLDGSASYNGRSIGDWLVEWLEEGFSGGVLPPQEGHFFIKETREWLSDELNDILSKAFKRAGFDIQVS